MLCSKACLLGTLNFTCKKFLQENAFNSYPNFKIDPGYNRTAGVCAMHVPGELGDQNQYFMMPGRADSVRIW